MEGIATAVWSAVGALMPIVITAITVNNYLSSKFEQLGDRIERNSAEIDKFKSMEADRRTIQQEAQKEYRERIEYLIHSNRERMDHHRSAVEKKIAEIQGESRNQIQRFSEELNDVRSYLAANSDYVNRNSQRKRGES